MSAIHALTDPLANRAEKFEYYLRRVADPHIKPTIRRVNSLRMLTARYAIVSLAIGGFATGTALFGGGVAAADLIDDSVPLMTTSCSFAQIDAALHVEAPETAARLDAMPMQKAMLQTTLSQPVEQRAAVFEPLITSRQTMGAKAEVKPEESLPIKAELGPMLRKVAQSCSRY